MIVLRYSEIDEDSAVDARARERELLDRSIAMLIKAREEGATSMASVEAIHFTIRFWSAILEDLANPENSFTEELRAGIISVGIWILRECERVRQGESDNLTGIIDVTKIIREGF